MSHTRKKTLQHALCLIRVVMLRQSLILWMSHVAHANESGHTYGRVMACIWMMHVIYTWMSQVTHMNESCHTREWVISHMSINHCTHVKQCCSVETVPDIMDESCHTYARVRSHIWMRHVTHMNKSCHTHAKRPCNTATHTAAHTAKHTATHTHYLEWHTHDSRTESYSMVTHARKKPTLQHTR